MIANLWMLKAPNGMFWYALDYIRALDRPMLVLVRPSLMEMASLQLAGTQMQVKAVGLVGLLRYAALAAARGELVYCPTPHPLPYIKRQVVTFHDAYPFEGRNGARKLQLLLWGLRTSGCQVAYINQSMAKPYLSAQGIPADRLIYAPNMPPPAYTGASRSDTRGNAVGQKPGAAIRLAAFGTDSEKKRYPELLHALQQPALRDAIELCLYGEENAYVGRLRSAYPQARLSVCSPTQHSLQDFLARSDAVIGIATNEGFGRPVATAIMQGIPCYLSASPTFREFFDGLAILSDDVNHLLAAVQRRERPTALVQVSTPGFLADAYSAAINTAVARIQALDAGGAARQAPTSAS
ncbi:hypothetical protein SAMN05216359_102251 [Roseateles sp. YR242]|uniref:hypothetical protein n=1 Tax=Roseateles sp. YR242 TaxID=1855305 RepID=UPI0008C2474F|nr:hypothetical protein [Roseateles sp. YR242]SEK57383.1 hypothetical protein SAMN05216359_102251 [Roseateles sp. YR242]